MVKKGVPTTLFFVLGGYLAGRTMLYTPRRLESRDDDEALYDSLEKVIRGMGLTLVELNIFRSKTRGSNPGSVQVKAVVYREGITGVEDCSRVHRGILPRLELAFEGKEIYLEVSSPGINRIIKDGSEFAHYIGKVVKCYRTDISDWSEGILCAADDKGVVLKVKDEKTGLASELPMEIPFEIIAKARLNV